MKYQIRRDINLLVTLVLKLKLSSALILSLTFFNVLLYLIPNSLASLGVKANIFRLISTSLIKT